MKTARVNGIEIVYDERGEGEPLVMAGGIGMQLVAWPDGFLDKLVARGIRVIVFDHRDVGESTKLKELGVPPVFRILPKAAFGLPFEAPYTLYDMADDVAGLLDVVGLEKAHLAGFSMGGMVAQATAIRHGHRLKSLISAMSHPGGSIFTVSKPHAAMKLLGMPARSREEAISKQVDFFRTVGSPGFQRDDSMVADVAGRMYDRCYHPAGFARQFAAILATGNMQPRLQDVQVPTLVMHGDKDPVIRPSHGQRTANAIPGARFRLIEGWGHDVPVGIWDLLANEMADHVLSHAG